MANRLKMAEHDAILGLARLGWSFRRIGAEVGVDRETVARHVKTAPGDPPGSNAAISITGSEAHAGTDPGDPNAAISIPGSAGQRSRCEPFRTIILAKLELGLTAQRIWQDLKAEHGFADSDQSVQRFVRRLRATRPLPFQRMECGPGEEAQVDFGRGAPIITPDGAQKRPHLFRVVLSCSRKACREAVTRQTTEAFLGCLENAFRSRAGCPRYPRRRAQDAGDRQPEGRRRRYYRSRSSRRQTIVRTSRPLTRDGRDVSRPALRPEGCALVARQAYSPAYPADQASSTAVVVRSVVSSL